MKGEPFVSLSGAGRTYLQRPTPVAALKAATCRILPGDRIAVIGPSGSGKSTLLHLMGGIDTPTEGSVTWPALGAIEQLRPGHVAYVFQSQSLIEALTVVENIGMPLLLSGVGAADAEARSRAMLAGLGLESIGERLPEELSGGQAQRVAVARALVMRPRLILADEPTGQLDHPTAQRLFDVLLGSLSGLDTALIVATHDTAIARRMARVWRITHGELEVA